jgi:hypothetical protein
MAFLTINGVTYDVVEGGASEQEPYRVGSVTPAFSGTIRSSVRRVRRIRTFKLIEMTQVQYEALLTATAFGQRVPVGGDIITGGPVQAVVTVTNAEPQMADALTWTFDVDVRVEEA